MKQDAQDWWTAAAYAALDTVEGMTDREAEKQLGISFSTVNRMRQAREKGESIGEPRGEVRRVLQGFRAAGSETLSYNEEREEAELARVGAIPDPLLRIMERESIAAVIRAQGMRDACRAARLEAEKAVNRSELARPAPFSVTPMEDQPHPTKGKGKRRAS